LEKTPHRLNIVEFFRWPVDYEDKSPQCRCFGVDDLSPRSINFHFFREVAARFERYSFTKKNVACLAGWSARASLTQPEFILQEVNAPEIAK
jgi:hypothetical protein